MKQLSITLLLSILFFSGGAQNVTISNLEKLCSMNYEESVIFFYDKKFKKDNARNVSYSYELQFNAVDFVDVRPGEANIQVSVEFTDYRGPSIPQANSNPNKLKDDLTVAFRFNPKAYYQYNQIVESLNSKYGLKRKFLYGSQLYYEYQFNGRWIYLVELDCYYTNGKFKHVQKCLTLSEDKIER